MMDKKLNIAALIAIAGLAGVAAFDPASRYGRASLKDAMKPRPYKARGMTQEQSNWNAAVDAKKSARKGAQK